MITIPSLLSVKTRVQFGANLTENMQRKLIFLTANTEFHT